VEASRNPHGRARNSRGAGRSEDYKAGDADTLAPRRLPSLLALEIPRGSRPPTSVDIRSLIREMSGANPLWGAPRMHGELLKLGIDVRR